MIQEISNSNVISHREDGDMVTPTSALRRKRSTAAGGRLRPEGGQPLGIVMKYSSPEAQQGLQADRVNEDTGEIVTRDSSIVRAERWALKSVVNRLLPGSQTARCMVFRAPIRNQGLMPIEIHKGRKHGKAFYHGLMACGDVWNCPVCNAKISERRRQELIQALDEARKHGLSVHLVTLTIPHGIGDDINLLLSQLKKALKTMSSGKYSLKNQAASFGDGIKLAGFIRTLEVTYGQNGFHPHFHILQFVEPEVISGYRYPVNSSVIEHLYRKTWKRACLKAGLSEPSDTHGVTVKDGSMAAQYVTKWGLEDEMTKTISKQGKRNGLTPWGLLRAILEGDGSVVDPVHAENIFRVYSAAFKGKHQLYWSVGLRKKLLPQNVELTDLELVEQAEDERADLMSGITDEQWKVIRKFRKEADLLSAAEIGDTEQGRVSVKTLIDFITNLRCKDAPSPEVKRTREREQAGARFRAEANLRRRRNTTTRTRVDNSIDYTPVIELSSLDAELPLGLGRSIPISNTLLG